LFSSYCEPPPALALLAQGFLCLNTVFTAAHLREKIRIPVAISACVFLTLCSSSFCCSRLLGRPLDKDRNSLQPSPRLPAIVIFQTVRSFLYGASAVTSFARWLGGLLTTPPPPFSLGLNFPSAPPCPSPYWMLKKMPRLGRGLREKRIGQLVPLPPSTWFLAPRFPPQLASFCVPRDFDAS